MDKEDSVVENDVLPSESYGQCKRCKKLRLLGNWLCMDCWDLKTANIPYKKIMKAKKLLNE